jgi:hypothetical protein
MEELMEGEKKHKIWPIILKIIMRKREEGRKFITVYILSLKA